MKKLISKDKQKRQIIKENELEKFVLNQIARNINFFKLTRWKAVNKLTNLPKKTSKTYVSNRCIKTANRKTFHKFSKFSRTVFIRLAKSGLISNLRRSTW